MRKLEVVQTNIRMIRSTLDLLDGAGYSEDQKIRMRQILVEALQLNIREIVPEAKVLDLSRGEDGWEVRLKIV
jgi:hypothetical protein